MTYNQALGLIRAALSQRPTGTKVQVSAHEAAEKAILDYASGMVAPAAYRPSPFCGSGDVEQQQGIKYMSISELSVYDLLYVSEIYAGKPSGEIYQYRIKIWRTNNPNTSPVGDIPWLSYSYDAPAKITTPTVCILSEDDGSGTEGIMVVDWTKLTAVEYQNPGYMYGALFGFPVYRTYKKQGGEEFEVTPIAGDWKIEADATVNGSLPYYCAEVDANVVITLDNLANMVQKSFTIKHNLTTGKTLIIGSLEGIPIAGSLSVLVTEGKSVTVFVMENQFQLTGDWTENEPYTI